MSTRTHIEELAYRLACVLPRWQDDGGITQPPSQRRRRGSSATRQLSDAVEMEITELVALDGMELLIALGRSIGGRRELAARLASEIEADVERYRLDYLWLFVNGESDLDADSRLRHLRKSYRQLRRKMSDGWLARKTAVVWMNLLIALPLVFVYLADRGDSTSVVETSDRSTLALMAFAVWSLAFLPGWLYVRFLGQRAGALWNEYVQNLHRLGLDSPRFLPRPPENSEFFDEWLKDEGYRNTSTTNLYRQKFAAYYGSTVSANSELRSNFTVTTETMFPVFMTTLILATGFTSVLWDTEFAETPTTVWDMLKFGFLGAYVFIAESLIRRFFQSDLRPSAYATAIQRIVVVLIAVVAMHQLLRPTHQPNVEAVVAFVIGIFPVVAFQALYRAAASALRAALPQLTPSYPLNQLDGLNIWYENRLIEEGIEDMENLATANMVDVILHTRVPVGRLVDWIDQAHLYLHLDRVERGRGELRRNQKTAKAALTAAGLADDSTSGSSHEAAPSEQSASVHAERLDEARIPEPRADQQTDQPAEKRPDQQAEKPDIAEPAQNANLPARLHGSIRPGDRAGTRSRVALRQLGVRNATDLLKAFPPDQIDPRDAAPGMTARFTSLVASGIDIGQMRTLVRVLDEDTGLAPVWNWQTRGSVARAPTRRPRSVHDHGQSRQGATQQAQADATTASRHDEQPGHAGQRTQARRQEGRKAER